MQISNDIYFVKILFINIKLICKQKNFMFQKCARYVCVVWHMALTTLHKIDWQKYSILKIIYICVDNIDFDVVFFGIK